MRTQAVILTLAADSRHPQFKVCLFFSQRKFVNNITSACSIKLYAFATKTCSNYITTSFKALQKIIADPGPATGLHTTETEWEKREKPKIERRQFGAHHQTGWEDSSGIKGGWDQLCSFFRKLL